MGGINSGQEVFRFDSNTNNWVQAGANVEQVAAGGDGAWLVTSSDGVYRFDSSSESFVEVTGSLKSLAVGSGAGIFGVNSEIRCSLGSDRKLRKRKLRFAASQNTVDRLSAQCFCIARHISDFLGTPVAVLHFPGWLWFFCG